MRTEIKNVEEISMKKNLVKRIAAMLTVAVMGMSVVACGGSNGGTEASSAALTEEEYIAKTNELAESMNNVMTEAASLDANDVEGAKKLIEGLKAPFVEFAAIQAPEKYADAQAKYKSGSEAMIKYLDMCVDMLDPEKAAEVDMEELTEVVTTIQNDFTEGANLMQSAGN